MPKGTDTMKFMLMMHAPRGTGEYAVAGLSREDLGAHVAFMHRLNRELSAAGELVAAEGLASPGHAKVVRAGGAGAPIVTDGPFVETKEFLAGYWVISVESPLRAYEVAGRASAAPGPNGVPRNIPIEVREVMSAPPVEL